MGFGADLEYDFGRRPLLISRQTRLARKQFQRRVDGDIKRSWIGSSYIATSDLIICGDAIFLFYRLTALPPNSLSCRVYAGLSVCMIVGVIMVLLLVDNLTQAAVFELAAIGLGLAIGLGKWNDARLKSSLPPVTPAEFSK